MSNLVFLILKTLRRHYIASITIGLILIIYLTIYEKSTQNTEFVTENDPSKERILKLEKQLNQLNQDVNKLSGLMKSALESLNKELETHITKVVVDNAQEKRDDRIAVLVLACNRPPSISAHLDQIIKLRKYNENKFPIIVSQDCNHALTKEAILKYKSSLYEFIEQPDQSPIKQQVPNHMVGYYKISRHYKWALDQAFLKNSFESVIITEDDLNLAEDFFQYFDATNNLLKTDKTIYCVSAWNDNGKFENIKNDPELIYRTDFFPGLGWMLTKSYWLEIRERWPDAFWDDWLREPQQRLNRSCIRPEISRTGISTYGKKGISNGQYFDTYLQYIVLNKKSVNWLNKDLSYLEKTKYDKIFLDEINSNSIINMNFNSYLNRDSDQNIKNIYTNAIKISFTYEKKEEFVKIAKHFGLMTDFKSGVARTAYMGVVKFTRDSRDFYIMPKQPWTGYNLDWH